MSHGILRGAQFLGQQHGSGLMNKELFEFVVDHMGSGGSLPDWSTLVKEWNEQKGHKRRYAQWRFIRDYERARDHIVFFGSSIWHERLREEMTE
jgi:hypothetical protein